VNIEEYENLQPNMPYEVTPNTVPATIISFLTPNRHCAWRVSSLDTKEPDTIAWLNKMKPGEIFFDVGANMGQYALIAAKKGLIVHAFEPESQNFALLCRNIGINNLGDSVTAWPLALSDSSGFDFFYVQSLQVGGSCSSYAEEVNFHLQPKKYAVRQGCAAITMDAFTDRYGFPTHVKIDVDGLEHKVIAGMGATLCKASSVLIELNRNIPQHMDLYEIMEDHGLFPDEETAEIARRKEGAFSNIGNVIFYRKVQS
jgi:FkbM family methyltransferase